MENGEWRMRQDELKRAAAMAAVGREVRSGMRIGIGSGSTVTYAIEALGGALRGGTLSEIVGVPTSEETAALARDHGVPLVGLHEAGRLDVAIDGADEIDPELGLIKGLGGALVREKIVAQAAGRFVIIADRSKLVERLGQKAPLPVEVIAFGWQVQVAFLESLGARVVRREKEGTPFVSDNGNYILDCHFEEEGIPDPEVLDWELLGRAGIVDHGLFLGMAAVAYVAGEGGLVELVREG
jgi:ribose 5-phosphate isomerase A